MVIISSGFHRTHVTIAAHEAAARNILRLAITGAYPTEKLHRTVRALRLDHGRVARLLERDEQIPPGQLKPLFMPELLDEAARPLKKVRALDDAYPLLSADCMRLHGRMSARVLARVGRPGDVYHFRAGFGHASVQQAQRRGMVALCDHAAVHPRLSDTMLSLSAGADEVPTMPRSPVTRAVLSDIDAADAIVVNSDFLRDMFIRLGYPSDRLHVVYLGVDQAFLRHARDSATVRREFAPLRLIFAGRFAAAKGAHVLIEAMSQLGQLDWRLVIAGPVDGEVRRTEERFLADPRVTLLGTVNRRELARQLSAAPIFVFPSFSEGSARVVFEALACGCYVITTPTAGSIVQEVVNGAIVAPGNAPELARAISKAASDPQRLVEAGLRNATLIAENFTQADYGDALASLYRRLSDAEPGGGSPRSAHSSTLVAPKSG